MPKLPSLMIPAVGFMCWVVIIMMSERQDVLFYMLSAFGCALVTTLVYAWHVKAQEKAWEEARIAVWDER